MHIMQMSLHATFARMLPPSLPPSQPPVPPSLSHARARTHTQTQTRIYTQLYEGTSQIQKLIISRFLTNLDNLDP